MRLFDIFVADAFAELLEPLYYSDSDSVHSDHDDNGDDDREEENHEHRRGEENDMTG